MTIHQTKNIFYSIGLILFVSGCDSSKEKPSANIESSSGDLQQDCFNNANNTNTFGTNTATTGTSTFGSDTSSTQSTFGLTQASYYTDIQPIVSSKCMSCHSVGSVIDLSNTANLPTNQANMLSVAMGLSSQPAHSSIIFTEAEKTAFQTWAQNGFPLDNSGSSAIGSGTSTFGQSTNSFGSDCGNTANNPIVPPVTTIPAGVNDSEDIMQALINSETKKQCDTANQLVDRDNDVCFTESQLDMAWCNAAGIKDKFQASANAGGAVETELQSRTAAGYVIDQCGTENDKPVVTLYKRDDGQQRLLTAIIRIGS